MPFIIDKGMVFHNATFDLGFFFSGGFFPKHIYDTMLASMIYYNGLLVEKQSIWGKVFVPVSHSLKECFEREIGEIIVKDEQKNIGSVQLSRDSAIQYCFKDVDRLLELFHKYIELLTEYGAMGTYKLHCKYVRALAYFELCGLPISVEKWKMKMDNDLREYKVAEKIVTEYIYDNLPRYRDGQYDMFDSSKKITCLLSSPSQMIPVFKDFGINVEVTEKHVVKESLKKEVISKSSHPFVKLWIIFKEHEHNVSTFGNSIYNKIDNGRIYSRFRPMVDTARISSRKGEINFLNLPANEETRSCFVANEGFDIIVCDYDGQETIVGADITGDEAMIKSVMEDADLHCAFARVLYPEISDLIDEEIKTKHKDKRNASKAPRFCFQFGGNGHTLAQNEGISRSEGDRIEKLFKELHKGVYTYGDSKLKEAISLGYIQYACGFKLRLPHFEVFKPQQEYIDSLPHYFWDSYRIGKNEYENDKKAKSIGENYRIGDYPSYKLFLENKSKISKYFSMKAEYFRLCLNAPTQGTAAHQTKLATILLFEEIERNNHYWDVRIANVIHDEFVLEVVKPLSEQYKSILEKCMLDGGNQFLTNPLLKMKATAKIADNWYSAK
jgi:DNA polymerase I-like protein with 3'-5' exonuclease and polymerase domains